MTMREKKEQYRTGLISVEEYREWLRLELNFSGVCRQLDIFRELDTVN